MSEMLRKTKIIATLGPATEAEDMIGELIVKGVDIFRLNMSHAKHEWTATVTERIRRQAEAAGKQVAVLMDIRGPGIRTGNVEAPMELQEGDEVTFVTEDGKAKESEQWTTVNYPGIVDDVKVGDTLLLDNGEIQMEILESGAGRVRCKTLTEGTMGSQRHINLPGVKVNLPPLTEKDMEDIELAIELGMDFVAMSFVRDAAHIEELKSILKSKGSMARVVAKIEDQEAIKNLDEIIVASGAVMVARGDLGIEVKLEELPVIQRMIIRKCAQYGRKVIVATHMLESMTENPVPTRAEVTDVANAAYEQADAVMLSGETSVGQYPLRCIEVLDRVTKRVEQEGGVDFAADAVLKTDRHKSVRSAMLLANSIPNCKILVFTKRGRMGHFIAHQRPKFAPIFAFSPELSVVRALVMSRAVVPFLMEFHDRPSKTVETAMEMLKKQGYTKEGDSLVVLSDVMQGDQVVHSIMMRKA